MRNELLMQTTKGTPMGELLRRYWHPIAAVGELDEQPTKSVRLMGEDLVLYKDRSGTLGLLELHCAHRRADLSYGIVEGGGLRCNYHGWLYDETGQCIAQPFDDLAYPESQFKDRIKLQAYPVEEKGGLVWAYLGPQPAPLVPDWEAFSTTCWSSSCSPRCPATGSRARRTPSIRCMSSGCTATGPGPSPIKSVP
jgi:5,5'-dehydrodivanillate O-demethylase oxygenase subunit